MSRSNEWIQNFCGLHRQIQSMREELRAASGDCELSEAEIILLLVCANATTAHLAQRELATFTRMSPAAVSGHLESLRKRDLVIGTRDASDRRRQTWAATEPGELLANKIGRGIPQKEVPGKESPGEESPGENAIQRREAA